MTIQVFKTATFNKKPVIVTLEFLPDTIAVSHGINAGRGNKFLVKKIENTLLTESLSIAYSRYCIEDGFTPLVYRVGQVVKSPTFDTDLSNQMSEGIHFVNDKKIAMSQEYCYWFEFPCFYKEYVPLPDGEYTIFGNTFKKYGQYTIRNCRFHGNYYNYYRDGSVRDHGLFENGILKESTSYFMCKVSKTFKNGITQCFAGGKCWKYHDENIDEEWSIFNGKKTYRLKNKYIDYYDLENIKSIMNYDSDRNLHGEYITYYPNGNVSAKSYFEHGKLTGTALTYYENGNEENIIHFIPNKSIWRTFTGFFKKYNIEDCYVQEFDEDGNLLRYYSVIDDVESDLDESMSHLKSD